jgi:hypothetical protein
MPPLSTRLAFSICASCQPCIKWIRRDPNAPASSSLSSHPLLSSGRPHRIDKHIRTMADPVARTASPYTDPTVKGPRSQQLHSGQQSSRSRNMLVNTVNKTGLHPGGVQPAMEHTELEEELHEKAHIDYDRVAIIPNPSVAALYEDALVSSRSSTYTAGSIQLTSGPGVRDRHSYHGKRCPDGILGQEDRAVAARQAHRQGGDVRKGHLVCSTAELRHARAASSRAFLCGTMC